MSRRSDALDGRRPTARSGPVRYGLTLLLFGVLAAAAWCAAAAFDRAYADEVSAGRSATPPGPPLPLAFGSPPAALLDGSADVLDGSADVLGDPVAALVTGVNAAAGGIIRYDRPAAAAVEELPVAPPARPELPEPPARPVPKAHCLMLCLAAPEIWPGTASPAPSSAGPAHLVGVVAAGVADVLPVQVGSTVDPVPAVGTVNPDAEGHGFPAFPADGSFSADGSSPATGPRHGAGGVRQEVSGGPAHCAGGRSHAERPVPGVDPVGGAPVPPAAPPPTAEAGPSAYVFGEGRAGAPDGGHVVPYAAPATVAGRPRIGDAGAGAPAGRASEKAPSERADAPAVPPD